jgi:hypothetical protein
MTTGNYPKHQCRVEQNHGLSPGRQSIAITRLACADGYSSLAINNAGEPRECSPQTIRSLLPLQHPLPTFLVRYSCISGCRSLLSGTTRLVQDIYAQLIYSRHGRCRSERPSLTVPAAAVTSRCRQRLLHFVSSPYFQRRRRQDHVIPTTGFGFQALRTSN